MAFKKNHKLRKPSGKYSVGCMSFEYEYESQETNGTRRIPCLCFYPSDAKDGLGSPKKYASEALFPEFKGISTNSYWDIPILAGKHPLLLFSTGLGSYLEQNTVQFEELASNGYIILSIGHEGSTSFELKSGELCVWASKEAYLEGNKTSEEATKSYEKWLSESSETASQHEQILKYREYLNTFPYMNTLFDVWAKDSHVALEMFFESKDEGSVKLRNHVDYDKVAAFGMSFGGSTALRLAVESDLIKVAVSMDGSIRWSDEWDGTINKPFLFMCTYNPKSVMRKRVLSLLNSTSDLYSAEIKDSEHVNFTDYNDILETDENGFLGEIEPDVMERIMNTLILDFFNKHFRAWESEYLDTSFWDGHCVIKKHIT